MSGCALFGSDESRRYDYIEGHKGALDPTVRAAIIDGKIMRGMSKEEVRASWGDPCWYCRGTRTASWGETWEYNVFGSGTYGIGNGTYIYFDERGLVREWSGR
jgi:hypothetical protein